MSKIKRYNDFIVEDRSQLTLPFKERRFKGKSVHGHLIDALTDLRSGNANNYYSKSNPETEIDNVFEKSFTKVIKISDDGGLDYLYNFINIYDPQNKDEENQLMYNQTYIKKMLKDDKDVFGDNRQDFIDIISQEDLQNVFSKDGYTEYLRISNDKFTEDISKMQDTLQDSYNESDDGLISCWRTVDYVKDGEKDIYLAITKKYGGVGVYWAWDKDKAEAYWGTSSGHSITLHGKVSVEDVNWSDTVYKSAYDLKDEYELRINDNGSVMVVGFHDDVIDKYIEFEEPFLVKVGKT